MVADGKVVSGVKEANYITSIEPVEIYVEKPESWNSINIYAWVSEQITSAWPGDAMTETATVDGKTMYYHNFGTQYPEISIIFNNGTADCRHQRSGLRQALFPSEQRHWQKHLGD